MTSLKQKRALKNRKKNNGFTKMNSSALGKNKCKLAKADDSISLILYKNIFLYSLSYCIKICIN